MTERQAVEVLDEPIGSNKETHMIDLAILIIRLSLGIVMIFHGVYKFQNRPYLDKKWKEEYGFPIGSVVLNGVVQIVGGLAVILGVFGRYATIVLLINMLVGLYVSIWKHKEPFLSTPRGKGWDFNVLLVGTLIALILLGDGAWSLYGI